MDRGPDVRDILLGRRGCPDHATVETLLGCSRCAATLYAQLDRRRALDEAAARPGRLQTLDRGGAA